MAITDTFSSHRRRTASGVLFKIGTYLALLLVVGPAFWVLLGVIVRAVPHWQWSVLTTPTDGTTGGLENCILGTLVLMLGVLIVAGSIGVLAGIHLSELA